jgi:tetratricopeptide (TPR) repeat protein
MRIMRRIAFALALLLFATPALAEEDLFAEAQSWENSGQWALAMSTYQKILKHEPENVVARYKLGLVELKVGMADAAIAEFKQVLQVDPNHDDARDALEGIFVSKAIEANGKGKPQDALRALEAGVAANPSSAGAHLELARELERQKQDERAIEEYRAAVGGDAESSSAPLELAELYAAKQQNAEAAAQFEEAIKRDPKNPQAHYGLGVAYSALGQRDKAIAALDQAMRFYMLKGQEDKATSAMVLSDKLKAQPPSAKPAH